MLFRNKQLQEELRKNGFVVIPFLNKEGVAALNGFYDEVHKGEAPPLFIEEIHMTTWCQDPEYKKNISDNLLKLFSPAAELFFENIRRLNNVFIVKKSGKKTSFKVHQDWNVVDETKYESVNVWVPLHDVDEQSGALWVVKGSHNINRKIRGAGYLFPEYGNYLKELEEKAISVKLKAGEAIVFYHSVIHGSPPNLSAELRKAACFTVVPKEAPLCVYFQPTENSLLEQHEPADDFIFKYKHLRTETVTVRPSVKPVKVMPSFKNKPVEMKELKKFLNEKKGFFHFFSR